MPKGICRTCGGSAPGAIYCNEHRPDAKYKSKKGECDGLKFDSQRELQEYIKRKQLEKIGAIVDLQCQVRFPLVVNGKKIAVYIADFTYYFANNPGVLVVEDVKGYRTPVYKLKAKLFFALYGFAITES